VETLRLPGDNRILFYSRDSAAFGFLSHMWPSPILLDDATWPTVEHYYQAQKSHDDEYRAAIRAATSPGRAKRLAVSPHHPRRRSQQSWFRRNGQEPREDWQEVKLDVMRRADWAKYAQSRDLGELLLATADAELVEDSPVDSFWGIGPDGAGHNWAGRVLMDVRGRLRDERAGARRE
jgi:ribA/ribD-fused uncharacterized protein